MEYSTHNYQSLIVADDEKAQEKFREVHPQGCNSSRKQKQQQDEETVDMNVNPTSQTNEPSRVSGTEKMVGYLPTQRNRRCGSPVGGGERNLYMDSLYQEIIHRFDGLRERMARSGILSIMGSEVSLRQKTWT